MRTFAISTFFLALCFITTAQVTPTRFEAYPMFEECESAVSSQIEVCFNSTLQSFVIENFKTPEELDTSKPAAIAVFFEVTKAGVFQIVYLDAPSPGLKTATEALFNALPTITPAYYNGMPVTTQFTMPIKLPLTLMTPMAVDKQETSVNIPLTKQAKSTISKQEATEYDAIVNKGYTNKEYTSTINIPLSHQNYTWFDSALNQVGTNTHTAQKPFIYSEVQPYYDFEAQNASVSKERSTWLGRKWWNERMVTFQGDDYWFTLDPGVDLQVGRDIGGDINTYNNTRLVNFQGGLGDKIGFVTTVFESQGLFADYFNRFARSLAPDGGNPGIIPGRGIAADFGENAFDYPVATGHISFTPNKWFNFQLGHGQQFIGDGYRSLFLSDNASPFPFFKLNTTFGKFKYTNTWMSLRDVRPEVTESGSFRTKFVANHYLSYNVTKRLNIGLFESVIWENDNNRGFDFNFLNPVIFYRAIEFSTGSRGGNALLGLSGKYKFSNQINAYGQLIIDEFSSGAVFSGQGGFQNKTGYQLGVKYYDAFHIKGLYLQGEYNRVRPFTYSHNSVVLNYGHNNQSLAHIFGANFSEFLLIARYQKERWYGDAKFIIATRGLEVNEDKNPFYGGDIFGTEDVRISDNGNEIGQGNTTDFFHAEIEAGYLINPATNLKVYASLIYRDFSPTLTTETTFENTTTWLNFGVRTDIFNWYYDF